MGYYKDPKKTDATKDKDGWLYTGDIGKFNEVICPFKEYQFKLKNVFLFSRTEP